MENCDTVVTKLGQSIIQLEEYVTQFTASLDKVRDQLQNSRDEKKRQFLASLEETFNSAMERVKQIEAKKVHTMVEEKARLKNLQSKLNNAMELGNQVMKSGSRYDVASNYTSLTDTFKQLQVIKFQTLKNRGNVIDFKKNISVQKAQSLGTIKEGKDREGKWQLEMEIGKDGNGKLDNGIGVAFAPDGKTLLVTDYNDKGTVKLYRGDGQLKLTLDTKQGLQRGQTSHPWGVFFNSDEKIYVTVTTAHVKIYSSGGQYLMRFSAISTDGVSSEVDSSQLFGLAIDTAGNLFIGNNTKKYISKHTPDTTHVTSFKVNMCPDFIHVTTMDKIVISSQFNTDTEVQVLDPTGNLLHTIGVPKDTKSWWPSGLCGSDDGIIYIASFANGTGGGIYSFTEEGEYLGCVTKDISCAWGLAYAYDENDKFAVTQNSWKPAKIFCFK